jgi:enoyl-CoA hydratase/carnithine racemase
MQKVLVENNSDGTTLVTINRPERRNAICAETALSLQKAFQEFERSATQRAAVITGAGQRRIFRRRRHRQFSRTVALHPDRRF